MTVFVLEGLEIGSQKKRQRKKLEECAIEGCKEFEQGNRTLDEPELQKHDGQSQVIHNDKTTNLAAILLVYEDGLEITMRGRHCVRGVFLVEKLDFI